MANLTLGDFYNAIREGAREATLEALAEVDFSTSSKQDTIKGVLDLLATEATLDDVKTAAEALAALIDSGALKTTLTGRSAEVIMPRAIRSGNTSAIVSVPAQARGVLLVAHIYGITGSFDSGQGLRLRMINRTFIGISNARSNWYTMQTQRINNRLGNVSLCIAPFPFDESNLTTHGENIESKVASWILGDEIFVDLGINGTFVGGEGFDCDVRALWLS